LDGKLDLILVVGVAGHNNDPKISFHPNSNKKQTAKSHTSPSKFQWNSNKS
jgi:hypothetical protein